MLLEICCDEFKDEGVTRPPIVFHPGLNTIMGASRASNSIGKTTFLLIIDFVFGGEDYVRLNQDVRNNVGEHTINFAFVFGGEVYRFSRSIGNYMYVDECDENYQPKPNSSMHIDTYREFLSRQYGMNNLNATFRELISGYFRIYGRNNYDERRPLKAHGNDTVEAGIRRLLQLYGRYGVIGDAAARYEEAREKEVTYRNAVKHQYISGVSSHIEYKENEDRISELEERKKDLAQGSTSSLLDLDSLQAARLSELKRKASGLRRQRGRILSQIRAIEADMGLEDLHFRRDYSELREFFPNADIKHIEEIDAFHIELKKVLKSQYDDNLKRLRESEDLLDAQIQELEQEALNITGETQLPRAVLDDYASIDREIEVRRAANDYYRKHKDMKDVADALKRTLESLVREETEELQDGINSSLRELNEAVCGKGRTAPRLRIDGYKSYTYTIKNDTGTGSQTRGMLLFDLVSLEKTKLPAIVEDSVGLKQVADQVILNIFELFNKSKKQVFIAIDKGESYSDDQTMPAILEMTTVLELSAGHELFGRSWNTEES